MANKNGVTSSVIVHRRVRLLRREWTPTRSLRAKGEKKKIIYQIRPISLSDPHRQARHRGRRGLVMVQGACESTASTPTPCHTPVSDKCPPQQKQPKNRMAKCCVADRLAARKGVHCQVPSLRTMFRLTSSLFEGFQVRYNQDEKESRRQQKALWSFFSQAEGGLVCLG